MFSRYLIMKNKGIERLYLYIDDYYEFSDEFNSGKNRNRNLKEIINNYIRDKKIVFKGVEVCLVLSGIVISYVILDNTLPRDSNWISDFIPTLKNNDKTEVINDLIDKEVNLDI